MLIRFAEWHPRHPLRVLWPSLGGLRRAGAGLRPDQRQDLINKDGSKSLGLLTGRVMRRLLAPDAPCPRRVNGGDVRCGPSRRHLPVVTAEEKAERHGAWPGGRQVEL